MKWSYRIARVAGIDIKVHLSFLLIVFFGAFNFALPFGLEGAVVGALLMLALFACIALHELGHSLAAMRYGITTREIILWPLGGLALLTRQPRHPREELVIALAGPAVNVVLAVLLGALGMVTGLMPAFLAEVMAAGGLESAPGLGGMLTWLVFGNVALAVFNMIPALPMDGGRVLRALLAMLIGEERGTLVAGRVAQGSAVLMAATAIWLGQLLLGLVAVFVFIAASRELFERRTSSALRGLSVERLARPDALTLGPADTTSQALELMVGNEQRHFAVLHGARVLGVVSRGAIARALEIDPRERYVAELMDRAVPRVPGAASVERVRRFLLSAGRRVAIVEDEGLFKGLVSVEEIESASTLRRRGGPDFDPGRATA